jgi:plastocyanin
MWLSRHTEEEDRLYNAIVRTAKNIILPATLVSIALLAYACGGGGSGDNGGDGGDGPVSFDVSMGDNFFEPKEFTVKTGQKVTFNLKNDGAAIHNMRVAGADNEYNTDDDALSDPSQFSPGDTGTLEWTAPDKAGEIDLKCEFHPTDSTGIIKVE